MKTIDSLTFDELNSIQLSNKDLKNWGFPISTELIRRMIPLIATIAIGVLISNIVSDVCSKR